MSSQLLHNVHNKKHILPVLLRSRCYRSHAYSTKPQVTVKPGDNLHGFQIHQVSRIPELELDVIHSRHVRTGAEHLHIARDDKNNVFGVGFKTPPKDNTGLPHILEHTVLCGSRRYPVRDPFFKMLNRSLSNFMNAFTAFDYTYYPFATTNLADFSNLRNVYMDAVFNPLLHELDFMQEGWRLEHSNPRDKLSPITFKGVVYNEMKGQMSDPSYLFYIRAQQHMFPGTIYANCSGGDPQSITDLTHQNLVNFHRTHYHPSNAKFFTYGTIPLEDHLNTINLKIQEFDRADIPKVNSSVQRFTSPVSVSLPCPPDPVANPERQAKYSISYLTNDVKDVFETFSMRVLSSLLHNGHSSPFYKALIETNLGSDFSPNTGYDASTNISSFSFGVQGAKAEDIPAIEQAIYSTLEKTSQEGFDPKRIEAAIHRMEMGVKHKTADFGLSILQGVASGWFNGSNPIELLEINKNINRLRGEIEKGGYFESLIKKYLIGNSHRLSFTMLPSDTYSAQLAEEENKRLSAKLAKLTENDKGDIYQKGIKLLENQEKKEDLNCLPTLQLNDISKKTERFALEHAGIEDTPVQWRTTSTNGLTYFRTINTISDLPAELKMYLPLFCDALTSLGTKDRSMAEIDDDIRLYTGGIRASTFLSTNHSDLDQVEEGIVLTSNCLDRNIDKMYELTETLIHQTNFENVERLRTLILGTASNLATSIADSGHLFARTYASSTLTPGMHTAELFNGMTQVEFMNRLAAMDDLSEVVEKLKTIATLVLKRHALRVAITCGEESISANEQGLSKFVRSLPEGGIAANTNETKFTPHFGKSVFPMPFSVNYTSKCFRAVPYTHADGAKLQVLASLMTQHFLHKEIREKNGAYGGGARYAGLNGLFSFYSYRDPQNLATLETFSRAIDWIQRNKFSEQELTEAKLSIFQSVDAPQSVSEEGMFSFADGVSDEMRQRRREALLSVTEDDVKEAAGRYLGLQELEGNHAVAVIGEQDQQMDEEGGWKVRRLESINTIYSE
ncbi:uncharacterized protein VTP21DRAFT_3635 [Calcarisporiella thermophila]|uniref:uncharacterized protein n=1 Tax=Calcarisporiella thermophila TaxID=911321 RepID=UPI003742887B